MRIIAALITASVWLGVATLPAAETASAQVPAVLIAGDAVAAQYASAVGELLQGRLRVDFKATPCGAKPDFNGFVDELKALQPKYRLIYFAYGLDAVRELDSSGHPTAIGKGKAAMDGRQLYAFLNNDLWKVFQATFHETKLIWSTTMPVPEGVVGLAKTRVDAVNTAIVNMAYNRKAIALDLHEYVRIRRSELQIPGEFMLNDVGIGLVASVVANRIEEIVLEGNDPRLPYVLVLGDSIVNQYSTFLRQHLMGKANVRTGGTAFDNKPDWVRIVRENVVDQEKKLGVTFSVIQFNWGLHALKMVAPSNEPAEKGGVRCVPLDRYEGELEKLVLELKKTGRKLVWASTTPNNTGETAEESPAYNEIAVSVMRRHDIPVNDLYGFVVEEQIPQDKPKGCHFPRASAQRLGEHVGDFLLRHIEGK